MYRSQNNFRLVSYELQFTIYLVLYLVYITCSKFLILTSSLSSSVDWRNLLPRHSVLTPVKFYQFSSVGHLLFLFHTIVHGIGLFLGFESILFSENLVFSIEKWSNKTLKQSVYTSVGDFTFLNKAQLLQGNFAGGWEERESKNGILNAFWRSVTSLNWIEG